MANSFLEYTGNGSTTAFSITFDYLDSTHLACTVNGTSTSFTLSNGGATATLGSAPASGAAIKFSRTTSQATRLTDYVAGSVLKESDLDTDSKQAFFMAQEGIDTISSKLGQSTSNFQFDALNKRITNVANPTSNQDVATKHYLENTFLTSTNKTALTTVNANIANINAVNSNSTNINLVAGDATDIGLVATNIGSVNTVATDIAKVIAVANDLAEAVSEVETVADDLNESTSEIHTVGTNIANVNTVGLAIANVNTLAGKNTELGLLGTSAVITDLGLLGTSANVTAMGLLGTSTVISNIATVAGKNTELGILGTSANATAMGLLGTSAVVTDLGILGTSAVVTDLDILATSDNVTKMGVLGTSANVTAMGHLGTSANVTKMGTLGTSTNVSNMATLAGISGLSTLASNNANVTAVAGKVTEIGLLGTSANISNMATLGTSTNISNMSTLGGITNLTNLANAHASITNVANSLASVNNFGEVYRVASSAPSSSLNSGDLYFNTSTNVLNVYGASGWQNAGSSVNGTSERYKYVASGTPTTLSGADANGNTLAYDAGFIDVYLNGIKMVNGTDVTVTSGSSIVFASALTNGDIVEAVTYGTFSVANMNASNLTSGTVPDARFPATLPAISGANLTNLPVDLTNLNATNLTSGTVPTARLSGAYTGITQVGLTSALNITGGGVTIQDGYALNWGDNSYRIEGKDDGANARIGFVGGGSEKGRFDASGNLLVGQTTNGITSTGIGLVPNGTSHFYTGGARALELGRGVSDGEILRFNKSGTPVGSIGNISADFYITNSTATNGAGINLQNNLFVTPLKGGSRDTSSAVSLGNSSYKWKDLYLGGGAFLGGTGTANKLDDYEEGTFTPTWSGNAAVSVASGNYGYYTKIGNVVTVHFGAVLSSSSNSYYSITNAPFQGNIPSGNAMGAAREYGHTGYMYRTNMGDNSTTITVQSYQNNAVANAYLNCSLTYRVD